MGLLFLILKIIGILLFVVLLAVAAVLLVPVRYRICIKAWDDIAVAGAVSWLCHLFHLQILYGEGKVRFRLRIFGIPIALGEEKKRKKKRRKQKNTSRYEEVEPSFWQEEERNEEECQTEGKPNEEDREKISLPESENGTKESDLSKDKEPSSGKKRKKRKKQKKRSHKRISDTKDGIAAGKEKFLNIKEMILAETNKNACIHAFWELRVLMRHYLPGKASGELVFGMGDPARTGQVLGLISCFPVWARYRISLTPDFEAESIYAKGEVDMKGHIRCWHFLWSAFRLFKDKNMKELIRKFRT